MGVEAGRAVAQDTTHESSCFVGCAVSLLGGLRPVLVSGGGTSSDPVAEREVCKGGWQKPRAPGIPRRSPIQVLTRPGAA